MVDALSRTTLADIYELKSISPIQPTWLQDLQQAYQHDPKSKQLLQQLAVHPPSGHFHLASSLLHPSCTCISVPAFTLLIQKNRWGGFPPLSPKKKGIIYFKSRIWVGNAVEIQTKILTALHSSPLGGHSGMEATYNRIKSLFAWPNMRQTFQTFVSQCSICQQAKHERVPYPGLLAPVYTIWSMADCLIGFYRRVT